MFFKALINLYLGQAFFVGRKLGEKGRDFLCVPVIYCTFSRIHFLKALGGFAKGN